MAGSPPCGSGPSRPPAGRGLRWQPVSPGSASSGCSRTGERPVVSGLDSPASSRSASPVQIQSGPTRAAAEAVPVVPVTETMERGRVQDRLVWEQPRPSRKSAWRRRKAEQRAVYRAEYSPPRRPVEPGMEGLCFRCLQPGHRKLGCTNDPVCFRCGEVGHETFGCKRPRSPEPEEELRRLALAKMARRTSPPGRRPPPPARRSPSPRPLRRAPSPRPLRQAHPVEHREPRRTAPTDVVPVDDELEAPLCVVRRSSTMRDLEHRLRFALVAHVGGARPRVSCAQVQEALERCLPLPPGSFTVHPYRPEDFLLVFPSAELRDQVTRRPAMDFGGFSLFFKKWTRFAQASLGKWGSRVDLVIEGIPAHAWDKEVVEDLLGTSCSVEEVAPETASRRNLDTFKVSAWTANVDSIPPARTLAIPEPPEIGDDTPSPAREFSDDSSSTRVVQPRSELKLLKYKVLIHVDRVEEDEILEERQYGPIPVSSDADRSGLPEGGGNGAGGGRTARRPPWQLGIPDRRGGAGAAPQRRSYCQVAAGQPSDWQLPPMERQIVAEATRAARATREVFSNHVAGRAASAFASVGVGPILQPSCADKVAFTSSRATDSAVGEKEQEGDPEMPMQPVLDRQVALGVVATSQEAVPPLVKGGQETGSLERPVSNATLSPASEKEGQDSGMAADPEASLAIEERPAGATDLLVDRAEANESGGSPCHGSEGAIVGPPSTFTFGSFGQVDEAAYFSVSLSEESSTKGAAQDVSCTEESSTNDEAQVGSGAEETSINSVEVDTAIPPVATLDVGTECLSQDRLKVFCSRILKFLAPPLLREVESVSSLRPDAEPFTPRRSSRLATPVSACRPPKKASVAETTLLKALGIAPTELEVNDAALHELQNMFDSPLREQHLRVLAAVFGKTMPTHQELRAECGREVCASA